MAEVAGNPINSTHLTVETPINIDTAIYVLNPDDLPMLGGVNSDGYPMVSRKPVDNTVFYWLEDEFLIPNTTLQTATVDETTTAIVVAADQGERFAAGDAILMEDEVMLITAVANDTLTVTRGGAGTTAKTTAYAVGTEILGLGTILSEGSIGDEQFTGRTKLSNYTQIFTSKISMTRTAQRIPKYGMPGGELPRAVRKVMLAEGVNMEQALLYGVKYASGTVRSTGGLKQFITTTVDSTEDWLTVSEIQEKQQASYDLGGAWTHLVAKAGHFEALNNLTSDRVSQVEITDQRRGRVRATVVVTEFGEVYLVRNRYVRKTDAFGVNPGNIIARIFQPMVMQPLAKTDDKDNWMFVAELGFQVKGERHMARWSGLDLAAALPADGLV